MANETKLTTKAEMLERIKAIDRLVKDLEKDNENALRGKIKLLRDRTMFIHSTVEECLEICIRDHVVTFTDRNYNIFDEARAQWKFGIIFDSLNFVGKKRICKKMELFQTGEEKKIEDINDLRNELAHRKGSKMKKSDAELLRCWDVLLQAVVTSARMLERNKNNSPWKKNRTFPVKQ